MGWRVLPWLVLGWVDCCWLWLAGSMLGTGTELARGTEKPEAADVEEGERRTGPAEAELSGAGVIGENVGPRLRKSEAGD